MHVDASGHVYADSYRLGTTRRSNPAAYEARLADRNGRVAQVAMCNGHAAHTRWPEAGPLPAGAHAARLLAMRSLPTATDPRSALAELSRSGHD